MAKAGASRNENREATLLLLARTIREVAFGFISIVLPVYWHDQGYPILVIGLLYSVALLGSSVLSMAMGRFIDRLGRKRILVLSSILWTLTTPLLLTSKNVGVIGLVMLVGSISPTGKEVGLFLGVEQAMLSRLFAGQRRTNTYAWFNLVGYSATAIGALLAAAIGIANTQSQASEISTAMFRTVIVAYSLAGVIQLLLYGLLKPIVERQQGALGEVEHRVPPPSTRKLIHLLSALYALDSFAAGLIVQGILVYWFRVRYHLDLRSLGLIFFGTNVLSALSSLVAARIARRIGLLNTMVFTHLPSNLLLMLVPFMPDAGLAVTVLLMRHLLSQMDVPTRQAYAMAMVDAPDRGYLGAWTNGARTLGTGATPILSGALLTLSFSGLPFFLAGGLKIVYDLSLLFTFRKVPLDFSEKT